MKENIKTNDRKFVKSFQTPSPEDAELISAAKENSDFVATIAEGISKTLSGPPKGVTGVPPAPPPSMAETMVGFMHQKAQTETRN